MKRKAVGFYWTLPVPWAGFTRLPEDVDAAAKLSRTIAYQREAVRRHARENGYDLIHEVAFLETQPDRGSQYIRGPLAKIAPLCRRHDAVVLYVDFEVLKGWRRNEALHAKAARLGLRLDPVYPDALPVNGETFDPPAHFATWRAKQARWIADKPARAAAARARALELRAQGVKNPEIARRLNAERLRSLTGRDWTAESLRKFLAASGTD